MILNGNVFLSILYSSIRYQIKEEKENTTLLLRTTVAVQEMTIASTPLSERGKKKKKRGLQVDLEQKEGECNCSLYVDRGHDYYHVVSLHGQLDKSCIPNRRSRSPRCCTITSSDIRHFKSHLQLSYQNSWAYTA